MASTLELLDTEHRREEGRDSPISPLLQIQPEGDTIFRMTNNDLMEMEQSLRDRKSPTADRNDDLGELLERDKLPALVKKKRKGKSPRKNR